MMETTIHLSLKEVETLSIEGDCFAPKNIHVDSSNFLNDIP